jgi:hypothetical protein
VSDPITSVGQLRAGMRCSQPDGVEWVLVEPGDYIIEDGKKVAIDNMRNNKWYVRREGYNEPPVLMCFDQVFHPSVYNFRE